MSDGVPLWALREAERVVPHGHTVTDAPGAANMRYRIARALTAAEQQGHERGVRERDRALARLETLEKAWTLIHDAAGIRPDGVSGLLGWVEDHRTPGDTGSG